MKNLTLMQIMDFAKVSGSVAIQINYCHLLRNRRVYLNRGHRASTVTRWLKETFGVTFTRGNDAPRGGQNGEYVEFESNEQFEKFAADLNAYDAQLGAEAEQKAAKKRKVIDEMVISEQTKSTYLAKVAGLSNKQAKKVASNFAARKLGFYSIGGMERFLNLKQ